VKKMEAVVGHSNDQFSGAMQQLNKKLG